VDKITPHNSTLKSPLVTVKMSRSASTDATRVATPPDASVRRKLPDRPGRARSQRLFGNSAAEGRRGIFAIPAEDPSRQYPDIGGKDRRTGAQKDPSDRPVRVFKQSLRWCRAPGRAPSIRASAQDPSGAAELGAAAPERAQPIEVEDGQPGAAGVDEALPRQAPSESW